MFFWKAAVWYSTFTAFVTHLEAVFVYDKAVEELIFP